jgi:hypothetical protein
MLGKLERIYLQLKLLQKRRRALDKSKALLARN